jgi:hypothetical protein
MYGEVSLQRGTILGQVSQCIMPPASLGAAPLPRADAEKLLDWLVCGAPDN